MLILGKVLNGVNCIRPQTPISYLLVHSRIAGYESINELYKQSSCSMYLDSITIPMVFINAQDDPIIPEPLLSWPKQYVGE